MTLDEYRKQKNWSYGKLAKVLGVGHSRMTSRWCKHEVIPSKDHMHRIMELTMGAVQPNDFYIDRE